MRSAVAGAVALLLLLPVAAPAAGGLPQEAEALRIGCMVRSTEPYNLNGALASILDPTERAAMVARGRTLAQTALSVNGAAEAAALVGGLANAAMAWGALRERLKSAGQGAAHRVALMQVADLSWHLGDRLTEVLERVLQRGGRRLDVAAVELHLAHAVIDPGPVDPRPEHPLGPPQLLGGLVEATLTHQHVGVAVADAQLDGEGRYVGFTQAGWQVALSGYQAAANPVSPARIVAVNGARKVTVVVREFVEFHP